MILSHQVRAELSNANSKDRTVEVTWSTGSKGLRSGWDGPYNEELSMDPKHVDMERLNSGAAPVLAAHDQTNLDGVIGVVESAWIDKGIGKAILRFSESDPVADRTFKKIQERILRNVSVGYSVSEYTDTTQKGDRYPTMLATRWQPKEISIVPIGFDAKATTRAEDQVKNEVEIIGAAEGVHMDKTPEQLAAEATALAAEQKRIADETAAKETAKLAAEEATRKASEEATREAVKQATAQERTRVSEITNAVRAAKLDESVASDFITRGVSMDEASKAIFKKLEEQTAASQTRSNVDVKVTRDEKETQAQGLENYLSNRMDSGKTKLDDKGRIFNGMSLARAAEQILGGRKVGETDMQIATRAMTTSDLPNILANVAEKSMRQAYQAAPQSFKPFCKEGQLRNYKVANRLQLGDAPALLPLDEHGEVQMGSVIESKETIQVKRYLSGIAFTKEMIVNDDLSALAGFSDKFAQSAANKESDLVYSILTANAAMGDGIALFHASHGNLSSTSDAISVASIGAGWSAMMQQKSLSSNYLNLQPKYLVVAPGKFTIASQFVSTALLANTSGSINPFAGRLQVIVDARLSGNAWYLSADPAQIDTIEVAKLEGQDGPMVMLDQNSGTPGTIRIICEHNVGVSPLDFRGLYMNPGA